MVQTRSKKRKLESSIENAKKKKYVSIMDTKRNSVKSQSSQSRISIPTKMAPTKLDHGKVSNSSVFKQFKRDNEIIKLCTSLEAKHTVALNSGKDKIWNLRLHKKEPWAFLGTKKGVVHCWNFEERKSKNFKFHGGRISDMNFIDNNTLLTSSCDGSIGCIHINQGGTLKLYEGSQRIFCLAQSTSDRTVYFGDEVGTVTRLDLRDLPNSEVYPMATNKKVNKICLSGNHIWVATNDRVLTLWDRRNWIEPIQEKRFKYVQNSINLSHDKSRIVTAGRDNKIRVYFNPTHNLDNCREIHHNNNTGIWISPFRPVFHPTNSNFVFSGELKNRCIGLYNFPENENQKVQGWKLSSPIVGSCMSFGEFHEPTQGLVTVTYAKCAYWKASNKSEEN